MQNNFRILINLGLFVIVSFIVIFYFFAKGVNIIILPQEASLNSKISLQKGFGLSLTERFIFFPGEKTILVQSPGFYDEELTFRVDESSDLYTVELKELPGRLSLNTIPQVFGELYIDNELVTSNDGLYKIEAGKHSLEFVHPMYLKHSSNIEIIGMDQEQDLTLNLEPNWASISLDSDPANAEVYLSDTYLGETPLVVDIVAGLQELVFVKEGYVNKISVIRVDRGQDRNIGTVTLELLPSTVQISSNPGNAKVFLNKVYQGISPIGLNILPNKNEIISIELDGYYSSDATFNLASDQEIFHEFNLIPKLGKVEIDTNISSQIYLNNTFLGNSPFEGNIQAIEANLEIRKKGYRTFKTVLKPNEEFITKVNTTLITEETARFNESPKEYKTKGDNQMILLNPDFIRMGAKRSQKGQRANETLRDVRLTKPFYLSVHEVTNAQYFKFKTTDTSNQPIEVNNLPVVNISWNEAALYCNWLSVSEGFKPFYNVINGKVVSFNLTSEGYRMPTEAEWSWTARKSNKSKRKDLIFPWGYEMPIPKGSGNYADESSKKLTSSYIPNYQDGYAERSPVGSFEPNLKGVYDLGGNVSEFVNDFYAIMLENEKTYIDLTGPMRGRGHVVKGSNWSSANLTELRYSYRDESSDGNNKTGFRVARWLIGKGE